MFCEGAPLIKVVEMYQTAQSTQSHLSKECEESMVAPFNQFIKSYGQLEKELLLADNSSDIFNAAESAIDRCQSLTNFSQYEGLIVALESFLSKKLFVKKEEEGKSGGDQWQNVHSALKQLSIVKNSYSKLTTFDSKLRARLLGVVAIEKYSDDPNLAVLQLSDQQGRMMMTASRNAVFDSIFGTIKIALKDYHKSAAWTRPSMVCIGLLFVFLHYFVVRMWMKTCQRFVVILLLP